MRSGWRLSLGGAFGNGAVAEREPFEGFVELCTQLVPGGDPDDQKHGAGQDQPDCGFDGLGRGRQQLLLFRLPCGVGALGGLSDIRLRVHGDLRWD
jgi:hypothetical protein